MRGRITPGPKDSTWTSVPSATGGGHQIPGSGPVGQLSGYLATVRRGGKGVEGWLG